MSACAADVCPVGALTVREFRFRKRAWKLRSTPSVCPGCSIGCNIFIDHHERVVYRFTPRENPAINATWLCDHGRFLAESLNEQAYLDPQRRTGGQTVRVGWGEALAAIAAELKNASGLRVVASANLSNEELFLARELFGRHLKGEIAVPVAPGEPRKMRNGKGEWLHATDPHPNSAGARRLGLDVVDGEGLSRFLYGGAGLTLILDPGAHPFLASPEALQLLRVGTTVVWARREHPAAHAATWLLPTPSLAGNEGTFTSSAGAVQRFAQAFAAPGTVHRTATGAHVALLPDDRVALGTARGGAAALAHAHRAGARAWGPRPRPRLACRRLRPHGPKRQGVRGPDLGDARRPAAARVVPGAPACGLRSPSAPRRSPSSPAPS